MHSKQVMKLFGRRDHGRPNKSFMTRSLCILKRKTHRLALPTSLYNWNIYRKRLSGHHCCQLLMEKIDREVQPKR